MKVNVFQTATSNQTNNKRKYVQQHIHLAMENKDKLNILIIIQYYAKISVQDIFKNIKNNYYVLMGISIFCLIVIVFTSSYAYFKTQVRGEGKGMNAILGTIDLDITENSISTNNLLPISDSSKDTKAQIKDFTVKRTSNSNTDVCYNLYLVVDSISSNIKK